MILHPHASVVFCDDIRQEANGKLIYIGVYNDDILFNGPFPWALPGGLWLVIRYLEPYPDVIPSFGIKVRIENKSAGVADIVEMPIPLAPPDEMPKKPPFSFETDSIRTLTIALQLQIPGMAFEEPSKLSVVILRDGKEIFGGRLRIGPAQSSS